MKKIFNVIAALALLSGGTVSCNYLDVSEEVTAGLDSYEEVFENVSYTRRWYGEIFRQMPEYSSVNSASAGMGNVWASYSDEVFTRYADNAGKYGNWNALKTEGQRWGILYQMINQANIFLELAHPIIGQGVNADVLYEEEVDRLKANARFMRALYHYYLMEQYGAIPVVDHSLTLQDVMPPRETLDFVISWIDTELAESMEGMEPLPYHDNTTMQAVPTKGVAMAVRAKLWVYAASPLFNGGVRTMWPTATLFPEKDNGAKLDNAVKYLKELIDYAEAGNYELYRDTTPDLAIYNLFQYYNREIIWANSRTSYASVTDVGGYEHNCTPKSESGATTINVLQELVDDFYMADGMPIAATSFLPKSPEYTETGFGTYNGIAEVSNMYIGREPRFYNTVTFSGKKWHVSNKEVQLYAGGNAGIGGGTTDGNPVTGYFLYKRYNRTVHRNTGAGVVSVFARPSIIFRLAEFYLLYAEMLNEKDPGNADVLKYLNLVRERAGLTTAIEELNAAIEGDQAMQREAIRRESRIELATEGQRYFDVRRWMIAGNRPGEGGQGGDFHGMNVYGDKNAFYTRTNINPTRSFQNKNYLFPIPDAEIRKGGGILVQNPGW